MAGLTKMLEALLGKKEETILMFGNDAASKSKLKTAIAAWSCFLCILFSQLVLREI
jgi:hypothetical protein